MASTPTSYLPGRLREALAAADFTVDAVAELLGPQAHAALSRNETVPGYRRTAGGTPLDTLIRLFLLQRPVSWAAAEAALPGLAQRMAAEGLLACSGSEVTALLDVRPYAVGGESDRDLWVVADLTPGLDATPLRMQADHVLGISSASTSLAQQTLRHPVGRALDLGTGCGVQALHLATHSAEVIATDVNPRALHWARFNAALNEVEERIDVRAGSLFEPVEGERFDLIATNPPFVISPALGERLTYRDSGMPGDRVVEQIVRGLPGHLEPNGWGQVLANWIVERDQPWDERLAGWLSDGCDALVVQREVLDPSAYVELWLRDAGLTGDYRERYDTWLAWLEDQRVEGIGFGWINLRRTEAGPGVVRHEFLDWPYDVEQPIAPAIGAWGEAIDLDRELSDDALLASDLTMRADVRQETQGDPGAPDPETIVLRQQRGFRRARAVDTVEAGFVGAADGELVTGRVLEAIAALLEREPAEVLATYLPKLREMLRDGFLE